MATDTSDVESDLETTSEPSSKKPKLTKTKGAAVYRTKFNKEWTQTWPFIHEVRGDTYSFLYTICGRQVSCSHQGRHDVERHIGKAMHQGNVKAAKSQSTLNFPSVSSSLTEKIVRAEVKVATMLVQHNIPLALADELTPLFHDIFPDSAIAKQFSSKRTKTACIINGAVAPFFQQRLVESMKSEPYALAVDGSSDTGVEKMNPLTIRIFGSQGVVCTQFLDMCMSSSTAEGIFTTMQDVLSKHSISWMNCVGVGLDNTSVNMGCRNSIKTRILQNNPAVYVMGCPCHIVHNTAGKAGDAFEGVSGFNIEELVVDLFYWFEKSTKRKASLVEYCTFCDINYREIVKHVNTRWLSLERAVCRVLQQYDALKSYFLSEDESAPRFQRLYDVFMLPMMEVYLLFYQSALQTFVHFNKFLQREDPLIPIVCEQMDSFLTKLASKFLPVSAIKAVNGDFSTLKYKEQEHQLPDNGIFIGFSTKLRLRKLLEEGDISPAQATKFYQSARAFYVRAMEYALDNLPIKDYLLRNASFVSFKSRDNASFSQVEYFVERFNSLLPYQSPQEMDQLLEEFTDFQLLQDNDIPQNVWEKATVVEEEDKRYYRMDIVWHHISTMMAPDSTYRFARLSRIAKLVLITPHSNAQEERVFSMIRKNKTAFRPSLDPKGTLSSILTIKLANTEPAHCFEPSKEVLKKAKSATWKYNKAHSKK